MSKKAKSPPGDRRAVASLAEDSNRRMVINFTPGADENQRPPSPPWMPFYTGDWYRDCSGRAPEEVGALVLLRMHYWSTGGPIEDDDKMLGRIVGKNSNYFRKKVKKILSDFFQYEAGFWRSRKLDNLLADAVAKTARHKEKSRAGAHARWGKSDATGNATGNGTGSATGTKSECHGQCQSESDKEARKESETGSTTSNNNHEVLTERTVCDSAGESSTVADVSPSKDEKKYKWQGDIIRLTPEDFDRWKNSFPNVQLTAELAALDPWLAKQPEGKRADWFMIVASALAKKQKENARQWSAASDGENVAPDYGRHPSGRRKVGQG